MSSIVFNFKVNTTHVTNSKITDSHKINFDWLPLEHFIGLFLLYCCIFIAPHLSTSHLASTAIADTSTRVPSSLVTAVEECVLFVELKVKVKLIHILYFKGYIKYSYMSPNSPYESISNLYNPTHYLPIEHMTN